MTKNKQPIACQEIFDDLKRLFPKKHAKVISENAEEISLRRVYGVYTGIITDPKKVLEIAQVGVKIIRTQHDPSYAKGRKIVLKVSTMTKSKC